jgi:hypothetical protein
MHGNNGDDEKMKRDIRKQTFSKPAKPSDEEIKKLTEDDNVQPSEMPQLNESSKKEPAKLREKNENLAIRKNGEKTKIESGEMTAASSLNSSNPFLLSRGQTSEVRIEKTGYRLRSDFMDLLKLVKRMKKGHTLEAVLDDALSFYFENSDDGRKAVKQRQMLDSDEDVWSQ